MLIPELQRRGIYWRDYPKPGGTLRENMSGKGPRLQDNHPAAVHRKARNAMRSEREAAREAVQNGQNGTAKKRRLNGSKR